MIEPLSQINLSDDYKINIDSIDQEHAFLIGLYNDLVQKIEGGAADMLLEPAVEKLFSYADHHFASEERLMWVSGFPELEPHKRQHEGFVRTLNDLAANRPEGNIVALRSIAVFISRWIRGHILITDKVFSEFIASKRTAPRPAEGGGAVDQ